MSGSGVDAVEAEEDSVDLDPGEAVSAEACFFTALGAEGGEGGAAAPAVVVVSVEKHRTLMKEVARGIGVESSRLVADVTGRKSLWRIIIFWEEWVD